MKTKAGISRKLLWLLVSNLASLALFGLCLLISFSLRQSVNAELPAKLWAGDGELPYSQISVFTSLPLSLDSVRELHYSVDTAYKEASYVSETGNLWYDAYSAGGLYASASKSGESKGVSSVCMAVGGGFFDIHPIKLVSGWYFDDEELNSDRVIIDRELAWRLYGGYELSGMSIYINGEACVIAGVSEFEDFPNDDFYGDTPRIYLPAALAEKLWGDVSFDCYEAVMPDPVGNYARELLTKQLGLSEEDAIISETSSRFTLASRISNIKNFGKSAARTTSVVLPFWENGARVVDSYVSLLLFFELFFLLLPACTLGAFAIKLIMRRKVLLSAAFSKIKSLLRR